MKKYFVSCTLLMCLTALLFLQQGCVKDQCSHQYTTYQYTPVYKPMQQLRQVSIQAPKPITANGKLFIKNNFIYLNEVNQGFHVIDNSNPAAPKSIAFVNVPGCIDIAAKGNYLLVDNYTDLLTFDISNPAAIHLVNRKENALPYRQYNYGFTDDSAKGIIVRFDKTVLPQKTDCNQVSDWWIRGGIFFSVSQSVMPSAVPKNAGGANGQAGSLSRFALLNDYLYIANRYTISVVNVANPLQPQLKKAVSAYGEAETIYPFKNALLMGSPTGMRIFSVADPDVPAYVGGVMHWRGCDPVVAENDIAYVTIRGGSPCGGDMNQLDVIDVSNLNAPVLKKSYPMQNPYGLSIYNNTLGICDGDAGLKLFNAAQSNNLQQLSVLSTVKAFDVILNGTTALLVAADGLYQYDITNKAAPVFISKLPVGVK
jgi:hypothetical protein